MGFLFKNQGVLGINARNLLYIRPFNKKKAIRLADSKLKTKHFLAARGISVPKLYYTIKNRQELEKFDFSVLPSSFVLKPNSGYGGGGIIPIVAKEGDFWLKSSGEKVSKEMFYDHIGDILDGRFSITNLADIAFFEQRIICDERIGRFSYGGLPDIRVIVHNLIPVLAMLRLPTQESGGRANLHQGALGVGIDIAKGKPTYIVKGRKIIEEIPGFSDLRKIEIPYWNDILLIASKIQLSTNLGYLAADIALDRNVGPILLEINARAGLSVQVANLVPLRRRLERISGIKVSTPEKGVRIAKDMFGEQIERNIKHLSGKQVVGVEEQIELILKDKVVRTFAQLNTSLERTIMDINFARDLGLFKDLSLEPKRLRMQFSLGNQRIKTLVEFADLGKRRKFKLTIGKRDLGNFYLDSGKTLSPKGLLPKENLLKEKKEENNMKINWQEMDRALIKIDQRLKLLAYLNPVNLGEEEKRFLANNSYNPQFIYRSLDYNPYDLKRELDKIRLDNSSLGILMQEKKQEIEKKITLLESIGSDYFTENSVRLYGAPSGWLVFEAERLLQDLKFKQEEAETIATLEAKAKFEQVFLEYGLMKWIVKIKKELVTNCVAGKNKVLFLKEGAKFSPQRLKNLIVHEIETHILTAENGKKQPYKLFNRGFANYLVTQEGLAIYNQEKRYPLTNRRYLLMTIAVYEALKGSFCQVVKKVMSYGFSVSQSFQIASKVKRGLEDTSELGGFTKDFIYFKGLKELETYFFQGGNFLDLYLGKINLADLSLIKQIPGLVAPKYLPKWLKERDEDVNLPNLIL